MGVPVLDCRVPERFPCDLPTSNNIDLPLVEGLDCSDGRAFRGQAHVHIVAVFAMGPARCGCWRLRRGIMQNRPDGWVAAFQIGPRGHRALLTRLVACFLDWRPETRIGVCDYYMAWSADIGLGIRLTRLDMTAGAPMTPIAMSALGMTFLFIMVCRCPLLLAFVSFCVWWEMSASNKGNYRHHEFYCGVPWMTKVRGTVEFSDDADWEFELPYRRLPR